MNFDKSVVDGWKTLNPIGCFGELSIPTVFGNELSYYEKLCRVVEELDKVLHDVNLLHGEYVFLEGMFNQLKSYVDDYFKNLDVQTEINIKLDNMLANGDFDALFSAILMHSTYAFESYEDIPANFSFAENSKVITKNGFYEVSNSNNGLGIAFGNVFLNPVGDVLNITAVPHGDIGATINAAMSLFKNIYIPAGTYVSMTPIDMVSNVNIYGDGESSVITSQNDFLHAEQATGFSIFNLRINGNGTNNGIVFQALTANSRVTRSNIKNIWLHYFKKAIVINSATGYNYFDQIRITSIGSNGIGISIGENNTAKLAPNYIYFNNLQVENINNGNEIECGIKITRGQYIEFNGCDFANFINNTVAYIDAIYQLSDIKFQNCVFFSFKKAMFIQRSTTSAFSFISVLGCTFIGYNADSVGIDCQPTNLLRMIMEGVKFGESAYTYFIFNDKVTLDIECQSFQGSPFSYCTLPANYKCPVNWNFAGKVTIKEIKPTDGVQTLVVGSSGSWEKIANAKLKWGFMPFNSTDKGTFTRPNLNTPANTANITFTPDPSNLNPITVFFEIM